MNLSAKYAYYQKYHTNVWNKIIHIITVPIISITTLAMLSFTSDTFTPKDLLLMYTFYYMYLSPSWCALWLMFFGIPAYCMSYQLIQIVSFQTILYLHISSWIIQVFIGHILIEKKKPAFLDSFIDSVMISPLFVVIEIPNILFNVQLQ